MQKRRRAFLKTGAIAGVGGLVSGTANGQSSNTSRARTEGGERGVQSYRRLGRTELKISDISFGASRLRRGEEALVHHAMDLGINYFDTAESYTRGQSEVVIGNAIRGRRDKVHLVSKTATRPHTSAQSMMHDLDASLRRLQTDYVDVYMNHAVNDKAVVGNAEWFTFIDDAKRAGKVRFSGISGHAGNLIECLDYALDEDMVDVLLVGYNFGQDPKFYERLANNFDRIAKQPELPRALEKAKQNDVGVVAMKTLMGARLNDMRPYERDGGTYAQAAFAWVLTNPNVDALIISMTSTEDIDEFVGASGSNQVAGQAFGLLEKYAALNGATYCKHACNECSGACPYGVPIADVLRTRMYATDYQDIEFARTEYNLLETNASACLTCDGQPCASACPNGIAIDKLCAPSHRMLSAERLA